MKYLIRIILRNGKKYEFPTSNLSLLEFLKTLKPNTQTFLPHEQAFVELFKYEATCCMVIDAVLLEASFITTPRLDYRT